MRCRGVHGLANPAFLSWFLCSGLLSVAPYCAPGGISVVSRGISGYARCGSLYSSHGWPDRLSDEGCIALFHRREDLVARAAPYLRVEDLDLNGAGVAGIIDRLADAPELDHPVPHHPPFQQRIACRNHPVVNVEPQDTPRSPCDLRVKLRIPEDVVDVDDYAHVVGIEAFGDVKGLSQGHDHRPLGHQCRVERFDAELHAQLGGVRREKVDPSSTIPRAASRSRF